MERLKDDSNRVGERPFWAWKGYRASDGLMRR
jgi:hypothetical protein